MHPVQLFNVIIQSLNAEEFLSKMENAEQMRLIIFGVVQQVLLGQSNRASEAVRYSGNIQGALLLMNNKDIKPNAAFGHLARIRKQKKDAASQVDEIFMTLLCRLPTAKERERFKNYLSDQNKSLKAYEDVYWTLMNSNEFFFIH
jgi:hypothetical protein